MNATHSALFYYTHSVTMLCAGSHDPQGCCPVARGTRTLDLVPSACVSSSLFLFLTHFNKMYDLPWLQTLLTVFV